MTVADLLDLQTNNPAELNRILLNIDETQAINVIVALREVNDKIQYNLRHYSGDELQRAQATVLETVIEMPT